MIIDTHAHIYLEQFSDDLPDIVKRSEEANVSNILLPNIDLDSVDAMHAVEDSYPNLFKSMMGMHPTSVDADYKSVLSKLESWLSKRTYCAIGEIGIDLYWDKTFVEQQKDAFAIQIGWAKSLNLPIAIHARDAFDEVFEVLDSEYSVGLTGVFHSFSGSLDHAKKVLSYGGFKLGIGGVVTFKNSDLDKVLEQVPYSNLVLETDAPFLTPVPFRGKRNEPSYLTYVANKLADVYGVTSDSILEETTKNAKELFRL